MLLYSLVFNSLTRLTVTAVYNLEYLFSTEDPRDAMDRNLCKCLDSKYRALVFSLEIETIFLLATVL